MVEIKVRLNICVPGAQMLSAKEIAENPKDSYKTEQIKIEHFDKKKKRPIKETLTIRTVKARPANQVISITREAWLAMISPEGFNRPAKISMSKWKSLSENQRLKVHMREIAEALGGEGAKYSYTVLDD